MLENLYWATLEQFRTQAKLVALQIVNNIPTHNILTQMIPQPSHPSLQHQQNNTVQQIHYLQGELHPSETQLLQRSERVRGCPSVKRQRVRM